MQFDYGKPQGSTLSPCFHNYAMNVFLNYAAFGSNNNHICRRYCAILRLPLGSCKTIADCTQPNGTRRWHAGFLFALAKTKAMWFFFWKEPDSSAQNQQPVRWVVITVQLFRNYHWQATVIQQVCGTHGIQNQLCFKCIISSWHTLWFKRHSALTCIQWYSEG